MFSFLQELDTSLETLTTAFEKATSEKLRFQEEVNRTNKTIELANRLVKGLEVGIVSNFILFAVSMCLNVFGCVSE